jgi:tRNA C32,U32 (ribose-2'-O)-methylase TrmJ
MNITQNFDAAIPLVQNANNASNVQVSNNQKAGSHSSTDEVSLSALGKSNQKIDSLFNQADAIYQSHITPNQQKVLNESYERLDQLYSKSSPSDAEQKTADALFDKIDNIFEQAEKKLTPLEEEQLEKINTKLDELLGDEGFQLEDMMNEDIEKLFQQSEDLLTSKLSTKQKKSLEDLNQQLSSLFEKKNIDDKSVDKLFEKIDSIITQGYEKLSSKEKGQLDNFDTELDELFNQLDQKEAESYAP